MFVEFFSKSLINFGVFARVVSDCAQAYLVLASMKEMKYFWLWSDIPLIFIGPMMSLLKVSPRL